MNILRVIACLLPFFGLSCSFDIKCKYYDYDWNPTREAYTCEVESPLNITTAISSVIGDHSNEKGKEDVVGFVVDLKEVHYFPSGLEKHFSNLKNIRIFQCGLREINQSDLKSFPNLQLLDLLENAIKTLKTGVFDYNPHLEVIVLGYNQIFNIDQNVFDRLDKLRFLSLRENVCIDQTVYDDAEEVKRFIPVITNACKGEEYFEIDRKLKTIEESLNNAKFKNFLEKVEDIKNSRYAYIHYNRIKELNEWKDVKLWTVNDKIDTLDREIKDVKHALDNSNNKIASLENSINSLSQRIEKLEKILTDFIANNVK